MVGYSLTKKLTILGNSDSVIQMLLNNTHLPYMRKIQFQSCDLLISIVSVVWIPPWIFRYNKSLTFSKLRKNKNDFLTKFSALSQTGRNGDNPLIWKYFDIYFFFWGHVSKLSEFKLNRARWPNYTYTRCLFEYKKYIYHKVDVCVGVMVRKNPNKKKTQ